MPTLSRPAEPDTTINERWMSYPGHRGIDFGWRTSDPVRTQRVYAALGGRVSSVYRGGGDNNGWGNRIIIDHGYGLQTTYNHLRTGEVHVNVGDQVSTGHHLARMGTTGRSDGVHLHFELYIDGDRVDPEPYFTTPLPRIPNTPNTPEPEEDLPVNVQLILYVPRNTLILVDHLNKTMRDLGNSATDPARAYFSTKPYTRAVDRGTSVPAGAVVWHDLIRVSASNPNGEYRYI